MNTYGIRGGRHTRRFIITLAVILTISAGAFYTVSVPHPWQTALLRYTLFGVFLGVSFAMALYNMFLYAFVARERAYLLFAATCFAMLIRFSLHEEGILSLLLNPYPPYLGRVGISMVTVQASFGIWFAIETLRLKIPKNVGLFCSACLFISFIGPFLFDIPFYLFIGLVPLCLVVVTALRAPGVRANPYRLTLVAGISLFILWTLLGFTGIFNGMFIAGFFPWLFFFFTQIILLSVEFSEIRKRDRELSESNALLESLSRVKSEFFSNISHEIKTPLTVIATDIALAGKYVRRGESAEAIKLLDDATAEVMRTASFVTDALRFARDQEKADGMEVFDFGAMLKDTLAVFTPFARLNGNALTLDMDGNHTAGAGAFTIYGSADLLGSAVVNLLTNTNNHTKNGHIRVAVEVITSELRVSIQDNGTGIPPGLLPHVFERGATDGGGTGLGLAIVKSIISQHDGHIAIDSVYGEGTTVTFTLPRAEEATV